MNQRAYPIRPRPQNDPRFTRGLASDVAAVLVRHGYPDPRATGPDFLDLQQALFGFLYAGGEGR